jgi:AcrR family transcriptional regulator
MLRPGPGTPREAVERSQRERLYAAAVACLATRGYEQTSVADLLELSGVSRSAFYQHFGDKEDCFLAAFGEVAKMAIGLVRHELDGPGSMEERANRAIRRLAQVIVDQPAAAQVYFTEIYTIGERGREAVEEATAALETLIMDAIGETHGGNRLPGGLLQGVLGGAQSVIQSHLRRGDVGLLTDRAVDLWEWALGYKAPSAPLRLAGRRVRLPLNGHPPSFVAHSQAERIIRALAVSAGERGYPAVTIAEIASRASVSQATFYSHFADKETALLAALDSTGSQMLAVAMPAARRAPDWASGVRAAIGALCAFYAAEPDLARLAAVEAYAAGPAALEQRERKNETIRKLLEPGFEAAPGTNPIVADAVLGALWTLLYAQIVTAGPQRLPEIAPLASYMVLAPFVGAEEAVKVSNGDGRGRSE